MPIDWRPFIELVKAQSFVLTSHMRPDCDAIGSEIGLALALRSLGKTVRIVNGDPVPPHIAFIDPDHDVLGLGRDVRADDLEVRRAWRARHQRLEPTGADGRCRSQHDGAQDRHRPSREPGRHERRGVQGHVVGIDRPARARDDRRAARAAVTRDGDPYLPPSRPTPVGFDFLRWAKRRLQRPPDWSLPVRAKEIFAVLYETTRSLASSCRAAF